MAAPVTLKEIATQADVSEMTVSKVLSGRYQPTQKRAVARATKIRKIAQKLGYRPNAAAKAIRSGRFGSMALLMSVKPHRGALFQDMLFAIHDELASNDLKLTLARMTDEQLTDDAQLPKLLSEWCCDGMLVNYTDDVPQRMRDLINDHHLPAVWVNTLLDHDCVLLDDEPGSYQATQALLESGHRRIAFVDYTHGPEKIDPHYSAAARLAGYEKAMRHAGLTPHNILPTALLMTPREERVNISRHWLSLPDRPTAVVTYGYEEVMPIMHAAMSLGLDVPRDLSLVTFGQSSMATLGPFIATMQLPTEEMGRRAVSMLLEKVAQPQELIPSVALPLTLDPGQTIAPPAKTV